MQKCAVRATKIFEKIRRIEKIFLIRGLLSKLYFSSPQLYVAAKQSAEDESERAYPKATFFVSSKAVTESTIQMI
jgi:hypothetical protein